MTSEKLAWDTASDLRWAERFEMLGVAQPAVGPDDVDDWLHEIHDAQRDTGRGLEELYGTPGAAMREHVARIPLDRRAAVDLAGEAPTELFGSALMSVGVLFILVSIAYPLSGDWQIDVTESLLWSVVAGILLAIAGCLAWAWRSAGRRHLSVATCLAGALLASLMFVAATRSVGDDPLVVMPTWALTVAGLTLATVGWNVPLPTPRVRDRSSRWSVEKWFARLEGLLLGRYEMSREDVDHHLQETRSYTEERGAVHPYEEFGPPEIYAFALTGEDPAARIARQMTVRRLWWMATVVLAGFTAVGFLAQDGVWSIANWGVLTLLAGWQAHTAGPK